MRETEAKGTKATNIWFGWGRQKIRCSMNATTRRFLAFFLICLFSNQKHILSNQIDSRFYFYLFCLISRVIIHSQDQLLKKALVASTSHPPGVIGNGNRKHPLFSGSRLHSYWHMPWLIIQDKKNVWSHDVRPSHHLTILIQLVLFAELQCWRVLSNVLYKGLFASQNICFCNLDQC